MKLNKIFLTFAASALVLTSCVDDDLDGLDALPKATATTTVTSLTISEGSSDVIPFTLSQAISKPSQFKIEVVSGNATQGSDYVVGDQATDADTGIPGNGFEITVPAFTDSFNIPVSAITDIYAEGTETVELSISAAGVRTVLINGGSTNVTLNIENVATTGLSVLLEWEGDVTYDFTEEVTEEDGDDTDMVTSSFTDHLCDIADFDVLIYPGPAYLAGTADCPEQALNITDLADGTYQIVIDLYDLSPSETPLEAFDIPFKLTVGKAGTFTGTVEYRDVYNSSSPTSFPGGAGPGQVLGATIEVSGGLYTIFDADGNVVASE